MGLDQIMGTLQHGQTKDFVHTFLGHFTGGKSKSGNGNPLLDKLSSSGMGEHVSSWMSGNTDHAISDDQVKNAFGSQINEAASATGIHPHEAAQRLAHVLPHLVHHASSQGETPSAEHAQGLISRLFH